MMQNEAIKAKTALTGLCTGHFIIDAYAAILIPLYPFIVQKLGINLATISLIIAIGHSISSILQPVFGHISDKLHKRVFMFWGVIFASLFMPLGFIAPNTILLTLCLMLGMIGNAFYHPQVTSIIKDFYKENLKLSHAIGLFLGCGTIGYAAGPYLSTCILKKFGEGNYAYIAIIGIITAFLMLFFVPKIEKKERINTGNFILAIKEILKNKTCIFLIIITVIKAMLVMYYGTYIPFLLKKFEFPITNIGLILTLFYIAGGLSMMISSGLEKHIKIKGVIIASYLPLLPLTVLSLICLKYNTFLASVLFIITDFFVLLSAGVVLAHAQRIMSKHTGTISGIIQGFTLALGSLSLIPFGFIGENTGVEYILILISAIAFFAALYTAKTKLI